MQIRRVIWCVVLLVATVCGDEKLKGIACRSVHLAFPADEGVAFYHEVTVDRSAEGTYVMVCGWSHGYFGLQELADGKKLVLFSVWDPGSQDDPKTVPEDRRVKLLHHDTAVRVGRFGGEGTGGQSFFDFDWKTGQTYRFLVRARPDGMRTAYSGWLYIPAEQAWKHLVTFSTPTERVLLKGHYSFIEDFRRNRVSTEKVRQAHFGGGWVQSAAGEWTPLTQARFTADANPVLNIDAAAGKSRFLLATGGDTENKGTKLGKLMELRASPDDPRPSDLPPENQSSSP